MSGVKILEGSHVANHSNWIVDHDGMDHVTIAAKADIELKDYQYLYHRAPWNIYLPELIRDFPWIREPEVHVVLFPKALHHGGIMSSQVTDILNNVLRWGEYEELVSVMELQDEIHAHLASPQLLDSLLHIYKHARMVIINFMHGRDYGAYDIEEEAAGYKALRELDGGVN